MPPALPADNRMNPLSGIYGFLRLKSVTLNGSSPAIQNPEKELKYTPEIISNVKQMLKRGGVFSLIKMYVFLQKNIIFNT